MINVKKKGVWNARNLGVLKSNSDFILFCEDDIRINENWIRYHLKCLDYFKCDISTGVFQPNRIEVSPELKKFKIASQFSGANSMVRIKVFEKIGLFDLNFEGQRSGDGEFGLRAFIHDFYSISNPYSSCQDIKAPTGGLREMGSWDSFRPTNIFSPRPIPSVLYLSRKYYGKKLSLFMLLSTIPFSLTPYKRKNSSKAKVSSIIYFILGFPFVCTQVLLSWRESTRMLNKGSEIPML